MFVQFSYLAIIDQYWYKIKILNIVNIEQLTKKCYHNVKQKSIYNISQREINEGKCKNMLKVVNFIDLVL